MQKTLVTLPFLPLPLLSSGSLSEQDPNAEWLPFRHSSLCARCHENGEGFDLLIQDAIDGSTFARNESQGVPTLAIDFGKRCFPLLRHIREEGLALRIHLLFE